MPWPKSTSSKFSTNEKKREGFSINQLIRKRNICMTKKRKSKRRANCLLNNPKFLLSFCFLAQIFFFILNSPLSFLSMLLQPNDFALGSSYDVRVCSNEICSVRDKDKSRPKKKKTLRAVQTCSLLCKISIDYLR